MAWRIQDSVIRGEVDNRIKGRVRGQLWLDGLGEPVKLDLEGNACADLAGCVLKFRNRAKTFPMRKKPPFNPVQHGGIGELTASQKVRVFTVPDEEAFAIMELQEKHGDSDEADATIAKEMGWDRELSPEEAQEQRQRIEEANAAAEAALDEPELEPDPATEGKDWIRTLDGDFRHPLQHRCFESAMKFWRACDHLGLEKCEDDDLSAFLFEFQTTGAKLAGALNSIARDGGVRDAAFTVACLKRALGHLHQSQSGLEAVAPKQLLPQPLVAEARKELFEIREGILRLINEYRGRD